MKSMTSVEICRQPNATTLAAPEPFTSPEPWVRVAYSWLSQTSHISKCCKVSCPLSAEIQQKCQAGAIHDHAEFSKTSTSLSLAGFGLRMSALAFIAEMSCYTCCMYNSNSKKLWVNHQDNHLQTNCDSGFKKVWAHRVMPITQSCVS